MNKCIKCKNKLEPHDKLLNAIAETIKNPICHRCYMIERKRKEING